MLDGPEYEKLLKQGSDKRVKKVLGKLQNGDQT